MEFTELEPTGRDRQYTLKHNFRMELISRGGRCSLLEATLVKALSEGLAQEETF